MQRMLDMIGKKLMTEEVWEEVEDLDLVAEVLEEPGVGQLPSRQILVGTMAALLGVEQVPTGGAIKTGVKLLLSLTAMAK